MADEQKKEKKIRILALCDSPTSATGFAQVSRNVLRRLAATGKYAIDVIGINYYGDYYERDIHPYSIYPAQPQGYSDMYGRGRVLNAFNGHESKFGLQQGWDFLFTIQDPFVIEGLGVDFPFAEQVKVMQALWKRSVPANFWFKWIGYFPVDAPIKENWVTRSIALCDYPVAYCEWGQEQILKYDRERYETTFNLAVSKEGIKKVARMYTPKLADRIQVIHHGVDTSVFKPISQEEKLKFREEFFAGQIKPETFLVVNVSRNQPRKDLPRTMHAFSIFKHMVPNSHLYLHCKLDDVGGSIHEMARNFDLIPGKDYTVPRDFSAGVGYPVEVVNKIYNCADLCVTTTLGEGWGFITTEAMATKTPVIAPNITSIIDIFGTRGYQGTIKEMEDPACLMRGIPVKAGATTSEWICMGLEDNERIRPLVNVDDMVEKMLWVHDHPQLVKLITDRGYEWVQGLSWDTIGKKWDDIFVSAYAQLESERKVGYMIDKAGRNDPCPCGSGQKFKECHGNPDDMAKYRDWLEGGEVK